MSDHLIKTNDFEAFRKHALKRFLTEDAPAQNWFQFNENLLTAHDPGYAMDKVTLDALFKLWNIRFDIYRDNVQLDRNTAALFAENKPKMKASLFEVCFFDYQKVINVLKSKNRFTPTLNAYILRTIRNAFQELDLKYNGNWFADYEALENDKISFYENFNQNRMPDAELEIPEIELLFFKLVEMPCCPFRHAPEKIYGKNQIGRLAFMNNFLSNQKRFIRFLDANLPTVESCYN